MKNRFKYFLFFFILIISSYSHAKKECSKKCYDEMHACLIKGTNLDKKDCYSENVSEMLLCLDSKGLGKLDRKRTCFRENKACVKKCK